jgi:hypothetical protein
MNKRKIVQLFCMLILVGCTPNLITQSVPTLTHSAVTQTVTETQVSISASAPSFAVISQNNLDQLIILRQWYVDNLFLYRSANFWFSDSKQFLIPSYNGIQSFAIDNNTPLWSLDSLNLDFTVDEKDQIIINLNGLQIFNRHGAKIQTIQTNKFCDVAEPASNYIIAIPDTKLIVTGQQDTSSDFGLNQMSDDKARLLIWDIGKNSCSELIKQFDGYLTSLSASYDGSYISYSVIIMTSDPIETNTHIYDLNLHKEVCNVVGSRSVFSRQNQLAIYGPRDGTISFIDPVDCVSSMKINVGSDLDSWVFSPNGTLLIGIFSDSINFWNIQSGEKLHEINSVGNITLIGISPDGRFLVTAKRGTSPAEKDSVILWGIPGN